MQSRKKIVFKDVVFRRIKESGKLIVVFVDEKTEKDSEIFYNSYMKKYSYGLVPKKFILNSTVPAGRDDDIIKSIKKDKYDIKIISKIT